jgi:hypothetical protein
MSIYVIRREMFSPNTGESLQDYPLATWPAQNLTRTFNCTLAMRFSGHYFRYSVLFHTSRYDLTATTTKLLPEEDDRVQDRKRRTHHLRFV